MRRQLGSPNDTHREESLTKAGRGLTPGHIYLDEWFMLINAVHLGLCQVHLGGALTVTIVGEARTRAPTPVSHVLRTNHATLKAAECNDSLTE